jgi:hypothetical protein
MHWPIVLCHQFLIQWDWHWVINDRNQILAIPGLDQKKFIDAGVTALSGWVLVCLLFVFAALSSYATLLYRKYYKNATSGLLSFNLVSSFNSL